MEPGRCELRVGGLGGAWYVKEVRYNGVTSSPEVIDVQAGAPAQQFEIVLDDKAASLDGTVTSRDQPAPGSTVILVPEIPDSTFVYLALKKATADAEGRFRFTGLAPREYRIVAAPAESEQKLEEPNVLELLLNGAQKIDLSAGSQSSVSVHAGTPP